MDHQSDGMSLPRQGKHRRLSSVLLSAVSSCCFILSSACSTPSHQPVLTREIDLEHQLCLLSPEVSTNEARRVATNACEYSLELRKQYHVVPPALLQNTLVNLGIRKRGLCYQWADDLGTELKSLKLETIDIHQGIARSNTFRVHCAVVLTARNHPFNEGLVLDAWRYSGYLYWRPVTEDTYPWVLRD
jgi:hypothetical protein